MLIKNLFTFLVGCCFGSFINVIVYRLPLGESIVLPGSRCPKCDHKIRWYENIPLISWIFLRGRCANCNKKISIITVVKNGMPYIKSAIKSFELQDYQNKELIIIYSKFYF